MFFFVIISTVFALVLFLNYPHWAWWLLCGLLLFWVIIVYIIYQNTLLGLALRRGWITTRVLAVEEEKWSHAEEDVRRLTTLFEEGKRQQVQGDLCGARLAWSGALRLAPADREIHDAYVATLPVWSIPALCWSFLFMLCRFPEIIKSIYHWGRWRRAVLLCLLILTRGVVILLLLLIFWVSAIVRFAVRKGWIHA